MSAARAALLALPLLLTAASAAPTPKPKGFGGQPSREVVKARQKAGFEPGWLGTDKDGSLRFEGKPDGLKGALPAFRPAEAGQFEGLPEVPDPKVPFALYLDSTKVGDAGLKPLAGLKALTWLALGGTRVSDVGLEHLAALKGLTTISLYSTKVSDAGLKHLAGLKALT